MRGVRSPRWALVALALFLLAGPVGVLAGTTAGGAASPHRAAVIVDTGGTVKRVVVTFSEDSITGIDALQRAGTNPVVYQFGGQGGAVCRLLGVGRDAGPNCLGGADGDPKYWAYFRAPAGTSVFKYSSVGAGSARVHDGDVEGWKFGTGAAPQYVSLASLLPPPPPPATQPPATAPPATAAPSGGGSSPANPGGAAAVAPGTPTSSSTLPVTGGKDTPANGTGTTADGRTGDSGAKSSGSKSSASDESDGKTVNTALASSDSDQGGSSMWSLVVFAILLLAIVVAIVVVRRVRARPPG